MKKIVAALVLVSFAGVALAQQSLKPEEMIKIRKSGYAFMAWNMGKIKANLDDIRAVVKRAAEAMPPRQQFIDKFCSAFTVPVG